MVQPTAANGLAVSDIPPRSVFIRAGILGADGEGGALTTNDDEVAALARGLRNHGETTRYVHKYVGSNYHMDGFQAAVLTLGIIFHDAK